MVRRGWKKARVEMVVRGEFAYSATVANSSMLSLVGAQFFHFSGKSV